MLDVGEAMQQGFVNLYQFLFHVTPDIIFHVKDWLDLALVDWKLVSTPSKCNPDFCLIIIRSFLNFLSIPRIRSAKRIRGISRNVSILKIFHLNFLKS